MTNKQPLPLDKQALLIDEPIYREYDLSNVDKKDLATLMLSGGTVDAYCTECQKNSVFHISEKKNLFQIEEKDADSIGFISISAKCSRNSEFNTITFERTCPGILIFCFLKRDNTLIKFGTYPSKGELDFKSLDPIFDKELSPELRKELGKAIGLRAHGIGIGSFVYLRRIFERLIENAFSEAKDTASWNEQDIQDFRSAKMPKRIKLLKDYLPNRLVRSSQLYGILSRGIHELSEDDCLQYFDIVKKAILMILKEHYEDRDYEKTVREIEGMGADISSKN